MSSTAASGQLISVHPNELKFLYNFFLSAIPTPWRLELEGIKHLKLLAPMGVGILGRYLLSLFELEKQSYCDLKVVNNTEKHVAFKVKTTSPKKYFVRPNTGVIQPWDSSVIRVTLQAQREYPPNMQCKDKFLLQSTIVPAHSDVDELPAETFTKESGKTVEELKLKVVYLPPGSQGNSEEGVRGFGGDTDANSTVQRLKEERDSAVRQTQQLQQELDMLKRRRQQKNDVGFSLKFALIVALIGIMIGFILHLSFSSPSPSPSLSLSAPEEEFAQVEPTVE